MLALSRGLQHTGTRSGKRVPVQRWARGRKVIAIGHQMGAHALRHVLPEYGNMMRECDWQHTPPPPLPASFTAMLGTAYEIADRSKEAESGVSSPRQALIARAGVHMKVRRTPAGCEGLLEGGGCYGTSLRRCCFPVCGGRNGALATGSTITEWAATRASLGET